MGSPVRLGSGTFGFPGDVTSVFGRVGAVVALSGDYTFAKISAKPTTLAGYGITNGVTDTDPRLSNDRTADSIRTATSKAISGAADPVQNDVLAFSQGNWKPGTRAVWQGNAATYVQTASTTGVMMGVGGSITPNFSNNILVIVAGKVKNGTAGNGVLIGIRHGTGTKPSNGDALTGTAVGANAGFSGTGYAAGQETSFSISAIITTAAIGTFHWLDIQLAAVGGGNAQVLLTAITAMEF